MSLHPAPEWQPRMRRCPKNARRHTLLWTRPLSVMETLLALSAVHAATVVTAVAVAAADEHDDKRKRGCPRSPLHRGVRRSCHRRRSKRGGVA